MHGYYVRHVKRQKCSEIEWKILIALCTNAIYAIFHKLRIPMKTSYIITLTIGFTKEFWNDVLAHIFRYILIAMPF